MKQRPILFSAPMVRALLDGSKTQTRRVMKPQMVYGDVCGLFSSWYLPKGKDGGTIWPNAKDQIIATCPHGQVGDQLWVRETYFAFGRWVTRFNAKKGRDEWHFIDTTVECGHDYCYPADGHIIAPHRRTAGVTPCWWKRPAIFMPRAASRITLEITSVRIERLQDISEADAEAEGVDFIRHAPDVDETLTAKQLYDALWESINGNGSWANNPWVWVIEFKKVKP